MPARRSGRARALRERRFLLGHPVCLVRQERDARPSEERADGHYEGAIPCYTSTPLSVVKHDLRLTECFQIFQLTGQRGRYRREYRDSLGHCVFHCTRPLKSSASAETQVLP